MSEPSEQAAVERYKTEQALKNTAAWFWWIGFLSLLNSILVESGNSFSFTFGLGVSQVGDALMSNNAPLLETLGFFVSYGFTGLFIFLGWLAKHWEPALLIGIAVYALDTVIFVVTKDWIGVGFHLFALMLIVSGFLTWRRLRAATTAAASLADGTS